MKSNIETKESRIKIAWDTISKYMPDGLTVIARKAAYNRIVMQKRVAQIYFSSIGGFYKCCSYLLLIERGIYEFASVHFLSANISTHYTKEVQELYIIYAALLGFTQICFYGSKNKYFDNMWAKDICARYQIQYKEKIQELPQAFTAAYELFEQSQKSYGDKTSDFFKKIFSIEPKNFLLLEQPLIDLFDDIADCPLYEQTQIQGVENFARIFQSSAVGHIGGQYKVHNCYYQALHNKMLFSNAIKRAYGSRDISEIKQVATSQTRQLLTLINKFFKAFDRHWHAVYLPDKFDVIVGDVGALLAKIKHIAKRLNSFISGEISIIEELE